MTLLLGMMIFLMAMMMMVMMITGLHEGADNGDHGDGELNKSAATLKTQIPNPKSRLPLANLPRVGAASICACCLVRRAFGETARIRGRLARGSLEVS